MEFMFGRPPSPEELELLREQIESMDDISAIDDEVRASSSGIGLTSFQSYRRETSEGQKRPSF